MIVQLYLEDYFREISRDPTPYLQDLGMSWDLQICSSIGDCYTFFGTRNVPPNVPGLAIVPYLKPQDFVSCGLTQEEADKL